ncbi:MAG: protein phosphatase CheZ [Deltaproteobacteria bacterium]|jgi:chemotaxis protein CheZ|nr:protein phosphatase CheZ [Deltaproteobacteria bacterium]
MSNDEQLAQEIIALLDQTELPGQTGLAGQSNATPEFALAALQDQMQKNAQEKELHKRISEDMLSGLQSIYKEIAKISDDGPKSDAPPQNADDASALFREASRQLDEIMTTTYEAADNIMNQAELIQDRQIAASKTIQTLRERNADPLLLDALAVFLKENSDGVNSIVTALSFQDLTGQRIKKVVNALSSVHQLVVETYVSGGLMLKKSEEEPGKDFETLKQESLEQAAATVKGSELKGPSLDSSQKDVDDLLAQLGL